MKLLLTAALFLFATGPVHGELIVVSDSSDAEQDYFPAMKEAEPVKPVAKAPPPQPKVFVNVDLSRQTMQISAPGYNKVVKISSGGGRRIPDGIRTGNNQPYCAQDTRWKEVDGGGTPSDFGPVYVPAITEGGRAEKTVFDMYESSGFSDGKGGMAKMPNAVRFYKGRFFHAAAPGYIDQLGEAVSGGCIRMHPVHAKTFKDLVVKHGGYQVTIRGEPRIDENAPNYCDDKIIAATKECLALPESQQKRCLGTSVAQHNSDGDDFWPVLGRIFGGPSNVPAEDDYRRSQRRARERDEPGSLMQRALGGGF